jgi:hypothetical protein
MNTLHDQISRAAAGMSDEDLTHAIRAAERCALCSTRARRDLHLMCVRCLREELTRRLTARKARGAVPAEA